MRNKNTYILATQFVANVRIINILPIIWLLLHGAGMFVSQAHAQADDNTEVQRYGKRYVEFNLSRLNAFEKHQKARQIKLLKRLGKKERQLRRSLTGKDSSAWRTYDSHGISLDSIAALAKYDSLPEARSITPRTNSRLDSLRGVTQFLDRTARESANDLTRIAGYDNEVDALQHRLEYRKHIDELVSQRTSGLKALQTKGIGSVQGLQKELYYAKAQIKTYQAIADEPDRLEQKAYEMLQGQPGFDEQIMATVNGDNPISRAGSQNGGAADLERMGYQTRRQLGAALDRRFGSQAGNIGSKMGAQVAEFKTKAADLKAEVADAKQTLTGIRKAGAEGFRVNPMRCLPFWQRFEKSYDFQTARPAPDGRPAMLQMGGNIAYRQSPKFQAGVGVAGTVGLGQSWADIRLSIEGIGLRSFVSWDIRWGFHAYAGYERLFKKAAFVPDERAMPEIFPATPHNTGTFSESALLGLVKSYRMSGKRSGSVQALYDFWWQDKNLRSPFILRYSTSLN